MSMGAFAVCAWFSTVLCAWPCFYRSLVTDEDGPSAHKPLEAGLLAYIGASVWPLVLAFVLIERRA